MEELFDRPVEVYDSSKGPRKLKIHLEGDLPDDVAAVAPIRLSFHGKNHYNSVVPEDLAGFPLGELATRRIRSHRGRAASRRFSKDELELARRQAALEQQQG